MTRLFEPQGPDESGESSKPLSRQLLWFAGLAIASLIAVAAVAYALRGFLLMG